MKIKQYLVITNKEDFAKGNYSDCFNLFSTPNEVAGWIDCGEIEIEVNVELELIREQAAAEIDQLEQELKAKYSAGMKELNRRRQELLALPNPGESR